MKLIIAIVKDTDGDAVSHGLTAGDFRVTQVASTGGFLRHGQTTFLIGVEDERVENALSIIRSKVTKPGEQDTRQSFIFVIKVDEFIHF
jgi:uncharacterized protein YaaQ